MLITIVLIGWGFYMLSKAHEVERINTSEYILKGNNLKIEMVEKYLDLRINLLRYETGYYIRIVFPTIIGGYFLGAIIVGWKRHEKSKLIVKALKILIATNKDKDKSI